MNSQFIEVITNIVVFSPFIDNFIATLLISSIVVLHDKNTILLVMITAIWYLIKDAVDPSIITVVFSRCEFLEIFQFLIFAVGKLTEDTIIIRIEVASSLGPTLRLWRVLWRWNTNWNKLQTNISIIHIRAGLFQTDVIQVHRAGWKQCHNLLPRWIRTTLKRKFIILVILVISEQIILNWKMHFNFFKNVESWCICNVVGRFRID